MPLLGLRPGKSWAAVWLQLLQDTCLVDKEGQLIGEALMLTPSQGFDDLFWTSSPMTSNEVSV